MTGVTMRLDVTDDQVRRMLQALAQRMDNLRPVLNDIGAGLESNIQRRFDTRTDPTGKPWAPWAPSTAKQRAKSGKGTLMEYTRHLRGSLSYHADADSVEVGFGYPYAIHHEFGAPKNKLPRRGLLTADPESGTLGHEDAQLVNLILTQYLTDLD